MHVLSLLLLFLGPMPVTAQLAVPSVEALPVGAAHLAGTDAKLRDDVLAAEQAIDLVQVTMLDSVVEKKRQRLIGFGGWLAQRLGARYWQYLSTDKKKYVGTISRKFKIFDGLAKEVDLNIFMIPHLEPYISMVAAGFKTAAKRPRPERHFRWDNPPYANPEALKFRDGYWTVECEGTPAVTHRAAVNDAFFPTTEGKHDLENHPNFGVKYPSFGVYGPWCMDCNHNCRPEIHPIEWVWWLDLSTDRPGGKSAKSWMVGLFKDGSQRFPDWTPGPMVGTISIPIAIPVGKARTVITLEHLVKEKFRPDLLLASEDAFVPGIGENVVVLKGDWNAHMEVAVEMENEMPENAIKAWWRGFRYSAKEEMVFGYLDLAMGVENVWCGRITVD